QLDVVFREDDCRTRKDHGPENLALLRRFCLNAIALPPLGGDWLSSPLSPIADADGSSRR
ncbi:MAG: hypothetical protein E5Y63_15400, partial [Mesorhizobium sp.]